MLKENRFQFFEFNGRYYGPGTVVKFKSSYMDHIHKGEGLYGKYNTGCSYEGWHFFKAGYSSAISNSIGMIMLDQTKNEIYDKIEEVVVPYEVTYIPCAGKKYALNDLEDDELIMWWVIYLAIMFVSLIFAFPINFFLWVVASGVFFGCRHEKLKESGYK